MKTNSPSSPDDRLPAKSEATEYLSAGEDPALTPPPSSQSGTLAPPSGEGPSKGPSAIAAALPEKLPAPFGRYQLLQLLGKGGMGAVYLARDEQLDRPVALKVPFFSATDGPNILERFHREARAAAGLRHANVCPVYDVGEINGIHYLTMAFIEGKSLAEVLRGSTEPMPQPQAAALVRKLALALDEAHRHQVVHRDLKPGNIMVSSQGEPIIMDFGLARRGSTADVHLTREGTILGTPAYMAPEQARGDVSQMGPACDVYSLGVILYELLAGKVPFNGDTVAILVQLVTDEPVPPSQHRPGVDPALEAICLKAMAKEPAARYPSMAAFAHALADYLEHDDRTLAIDAAPAVTKKPSAAPLPASGQGSRGRKVLALVAAGVVILLLGVGGLVFALRGGKPGTDQSPGPGMEPEVQADQPVAYAWPADALREGKVPAPHLDGVRPLFEDSYDDPGSGFPIGEGGRGGTHGYRKGRYFIEVPGRGASFWAVPYYRARQGALPVDFVCQLVGTAHGAKARWALSIRDRRAEDKSQRLTVAISTTGLLRVTEASSESGFTLLGDPVSHPAIKTGDDVFNTLLVVLRGRQLELYVNGVAVCDPLLLEDAIAAPALALECRTGTPDGGTAEFDNITVWPADSLPPLTARGARPVK